MSLEEVGSNQDIVTMNTEVMSAPDYGSDDSVSASDFGPPVNLLQKARNQKPVMYARRATKLAASILKKARTRSTSRSRRSSRFCSKRISLKFRIYRLEIACKRLMDDIDSSWEETRKALLKGFEAMRQTQLSRENMINPHEHDAISGSRGSSAVTGQLEHIAGGDRYI